MIDPEKRERAITLLRTQLQNAVYGIVAEYCNDELGEFIDIVAPKTQKDLAVNQLRQMLVLAAGGDTIGDDLIEQFVDFLITEPIKAN